MASSTAIAFQRLTDTSSVMDMTFPQDLLPLILEYVAEERKENPYVYQRQLTFIANIMAAYATQITHNLIWNIRIDETLEFARLNSPSLMMEAKIKDPHEQQLEATPLIALQMAGDRNPRKLKDDEKDYGLVEQLRSCFSDTKEADNQLEKWRINSDEASEIIITPIIAAMKLLCQQVIDSKEITNPDHFEDYLDLPIAVDFRKALKPDPKNVAKGGFLFPWTIFLTFMEIFKMNVNNLGGWWSLKSDVFDGIVYPALQERVSRGDLPHLHKGLGNIDVKGMPKRMDFSNGTPADLKGLGASFFFGFYGHKFGLDSVAGARGGEQGMQLFHRRFHNLYQAKTAIVELRLTSETCLRASA